jgi:hypothetical protein
MRTWGTKLTSISNTIRRILGITKYPVSPYAGIDSIDGMLTNGRYTPDHYNPGGSNNIYTFCSTDIRFVANTNVTLTRAFANGPANPMSAARLQFTTTTAQAFFWNSGVAPVAGTYTLRFKVKSNTGSGSQVIRYGSTALTSVTIDEVSWATVTLQFTTSGSDWRTGLLTGSGSNTPDVLLDEIQFYEGVSSNVPDFSTEVFTGDFRPALAYINSQKRSGQVYDNSALGGSGVLRLPTYPATKTFTEITALVAFRNDVSSNNGPVLCADFDPTLGTSLTSFALSVNTSGSPQFYPSPTNLSKTTVLGEGWHIIGIRLKPTARSISFHEIELALDSATWNGLAAKLFRIGSSGGSLNSHLTTWQMRGKFSDIVVFDSYLSDNDYYTCVKALRERVARAGETMAPMPAYLITMGDSQTASFTGARGPSWGVLQADAGRYNPTLNMRNFAVGGYNLANLVAQLPVVTKTIAEVLKLSGRKPVVAIYTGTNDQVAIVSSPSTHWANIVSALINPIIAAGGIPVIGTLCPDGGSPPIGFEAARLVFNSIILSSGYPVMDFGGDAVMGNVANCTGTNYDTDFRHFSTAGQVLLAAIAQPTIQAVIT